MAGVFCNCPYLRKLEVSNILIAAIAKKRPSSAIFTYRQQKQLILIRSTIAVVLSFTGWLKSRLLQMHEKKLNS